MYATYAIPSIHMIDNAIIIIIIIILLLVVV